MKSRKRTPSDFIFEGELGHGSYSTVVKAIDKRTKKVYAIKICSKAHIIRERKVKYVTIEKNTLNLLARANHPGIVKLYYTFHDADNLYFVLDYAPGGELLALLHKVGRFTEVWSKHFTIQLVDTVEYMHSQGVIHRDLKPENILLDREGRLMITDFGAASAPIAASTANLSNGNTKNTANIHTDGTPADSESEIEAGTGPGIENGNEDTSGTSSFVGTAEYVSPELLLHNRCSFSSDIWAVGCMIYQFMEGHPPFHGENELQTFEKIVELDYSWRKGSNPNKINPQIINLVGKILVIDDKERINLKNVKLHPWFSGVNWDDKSTIWKGIWPMHQQQQQHEHEQNQRKNVAQTLSQTLLNDQRNYISSSSNPGSVSEGTTFANSLPTNKHMISNRQLHVIETPIKNITIAKQKRKKPAKISNTTSSIVEWRRKLGISAGVGTGTSTTVSSQLPTTNTPTLPINLARTDKAHARLHGQRKNHTPNLPAGGRGTPPIIPIFFNNKSQMKKSISTNSVAIKTIPNSSHPSSSLRKASPVGLPQDGISQGQSLPRVDAGTTTMNDRYGTGHAGGTTGGTASNVKSTRSDEVIARRERKFSAPTIPTEQLLPPPLPITGDSKNSSKDSRFNSDSSIISALPERTLSGSTSDDLHILKRDFVYIYSIPYREDGAAMSIRSYNRIDNDLITELVSKYESVLKATGEEPKLMTLHDSGLLFYSDSLESKVTNIVNIGDSDLSMYDFEFDQSTRKGFLILEKYKHMIWFISLPSYTVVSKQASIQSNSLSPHMVIKNVFENWVDCFFRARKLLEEREEENLLNAVGHISLDSDLDYNSINNKSSSGSSPQAIPGTQDIVSHTSTSFNSVSESKMTITGATMTPKTTATTATTSDGTKASQGSKLATTTAAIGVDKVQKPIKERPQHILPPITHKGSYLSSSLPQRKTSSLGLASSLRHAQPLNNAPSPQVGLPKPGSIRQGIKLRSSSGSGSGTRIGAGTLTDGAKGHRVRTVTSTTAVTPHSDSTRSNFYGSPSSSTPGDGSHATASASVSPRLMVSPRFRTSPASPHIKKYVAPSNMLISSSRYEVIHALDPQIKADSNPQGIASSGASAAFRNLQQQQRHRRGTKSTRKK